MKRIAARANWMRARATNVLRRPLAITITAAVLSATMFVLLLLVPGRATRASSQAVAQIPDRPDSATTLQVRNQARRQLAIADSLLNLARSEAAAPEPEIVDTLPPHLVPRREELTAAVNALSALISRASSAPLPSSYRALGESPVMSGVPGVRELLDSLTSLERDRESFGAVTGADPLYIALTARVNAIGRSIVAAAEQRRAALRRDLVALLPPPPPPRPVIVIDTLRVLSQRDEARDYLLGADEELARIRQRNAEITEMERRARQLRDVGAPLSATAAAALIVGFAVAFAFVLLSEMRAPRVADLREAERTAGVRVLAVVQPRAFVAERDRRRGDEALPENIDPFSDHYRKIYLPLTAREEPLAAVTFTGDEPSVVATVAVNVAAYDVREARSAIVIDTDPPSAAVARALDIAAEPGLSDVLSGTAEWTDAVQYVSVGRDQVLAVMPSGRRSGQPSADRAERVRSDLMRLSSRHDLIVFTAAPSQTRQHPTTVLLSSDTVVCARIGHTRIKTLRALMERVRSAGMTVHGVVLWDAEPPRLGRQRHAPAPAARREPETVTA